MCCRGIVVGTSASVESGDGQPNFRWADIEPIQRLQ